MRERVVEHVRLIRYDGNDGDFMYFSCPSWSREDIRHDITVCKRTGIVTCTCEDAVCRRKSWDILGQDGQDICKHVRNLRAYVLPRLREGILG